MSGVSAIKIEWGNDDLFTHMLVVGPTRCGKTATVLKPMIYQLLLIKKRGVPLGLSVIEPKGDMAAMVAEMCGEMDMPFVHVDPERANSAVFNPLEGDIDDVAEATVVVLKSLFGKQEAFFATVQELASRNVTKLLKRLYGNDVTLPDVVRTIRDPLQMEDKVRELAFKFGEYDDLVQFFQSELLGAQREKYQQFVIGLRAQLENLTSNAHLSKVISGKSSINIDRHFAEGGVLAVNTSLGKLRKAGDAFGQFVVMHLQSGTLRRPGTEKTRVPHILIVDEYSRYINPDVELFLSIAAEYRTAGIFAIQSLGQLEVESGNLNAKAMKQSIMTSCRNKIAFGGLSAADAKEFAEEFGKKRVIRRESTFKQQTIIPNLLPETYRDSEKEEYRILPVYLQDGLPRFHFIAKLLQDGTPMPPKLGRGTFVPSDWRERREWERKNVFKLFVSRFRKNHVAEDAQPLANPDVESSDNEDLSSEHQKAWNHPKFISPSAPEEDRVAVFVEQEERDLFE